MFGFGGKNEDKLKKNMEEIKDLIENGGGLGDKQEEGQQDSFDQGSFDRDFSGDANKDQGQQASGANFGSDFDSDFDSDDQEDQGFQQDDNSFDNPTTSFADQDSPVNEEQQQAQTDSQTADFQENDDGGQQAPEPVEPAQNAQSRSQSNMNAGEKPPQPQPQRQTQQDQKAQEQPAQPQQQRDQREKRGPAQQKEQRRREKKDGSLQASIPKPAETKDINVPEIEKGPLFIKRQKFESAQKMIQDMRYLSQEIEAVVDELEQGIRHDQQTERNARELLHTFEENRTSVKDIISPGEE